MKIVGLTGGIGSGKTTVARMFNKLGVPVYNSDQQAKKLMETSKALKDGIVKLFGEEAFKGKKLNKMYLASKIFNNGEAMKSMNALVHPAVRKHFLSWALKQKAPYVIQEAAIIFENDAQDFYDATILVSAPQDSRLQRVMKRDKVSTEKIRARIDSQWPDEKKIPLATYVIENLEIEKTKAYVFAINNALLAFCKG